MAGAREILAAAERRLSAAGVPSAAREAAELLGAVWGRPWMDLYLEKGAPPAEALARFEAMVARRARREPLQHVLGFVDFAGSRFAVGPGVLVPRPETETLVETGEAECRRHLAGSGERGQGSDPFSVLELCCGSAAVLLALRARRKAEAGRLRWIGADLSADALDWGIKNRQQLETRAPNPETGTPSPEPRNQDPQPWAPGSGPRVPDPGFRVPGSVRFLLCDLASAFRDAAFDLVLCNPPYIPSGEIPSLAPEIRAFEPHAALDGGSDGLAFYRRLAAEVPRILVPGGALLAEIGNGQEIAVEELFRSAGWMGIAFLPDFSGVPRVLSARRIPHVPGEGRRG